MHIEETRQQCLARPIDVLSIFRSDDSRRRAYRRDALTVDDNRLIFPNRSLLRIKKADMLHRNWMIQMLSQFVCQAGIAGVFSRAVEGIELIVCTFPSLSQYCEPLTRRPEKMLIVIEPDRLRLKGKSCDRKLGYVQLPSVIFEGHVRHPFQSRLARREQLYGSTLRRVKVHRQAKPTPLTRRCC